MLTQKWSALSVSIIGLTLGEGAGIRSTLHHRSEMLRSGSSGQGWFARDRARGNSLEGAERQSASHQERLHGGGRKRRGRETESANDEWVAPAMFDILVGYLYDPAKTTAETTTSP